MSVIGRFPSGPAMIQPRGALMKNKPDVIRYMLSGNSIFTVANKGYARCTYRLAKCYDKELWFLSVLIGSGEYVFIGTVYKYGDGFALKISVKSNFNETSKPVILFGGLIRELMNNSLTELTDTMEFYHSGYCGRCGRLLTTPESVSAGLGPECIKMVGIATVTKPAPACAGKTEEEMIASYDTLQKIVDQLEWCQYENQAGYLKNNIAFIALQRMAKKEGEQK